VTRGPITGRAGATIAAGQAPAEDAAAGRGKVYLVGAGPGDPELLTLKARRILGTADAVLYDELANSAILDWAPAAAERLYVGKRDRCHSLPQEEIQRHLIARARQGKCVVRLKGGDPFLFGRGGEEAAVLTAAGIPWEVIPGVSAGLAAPALAGIPLTHRGLAAQVVFRSGHACGLTAPPRPTQVIFMGLGRIRAVVAELTAEGWPAATPVAVIAQASLPGQQVVRGRLENIAARVAAAHLPNPALIVVGAVAAFGAAERDAGAPGQAEETVAAAQAPAIAANSGLVVLAHGSSLPQWHASVQRLVAALAPGAGGWARAAYLPPAAPALAAVAEEAAAAGLRRLIVVPYFLADGLHVTRDIPALVDAARQRHPALDIRLTASLEGHPALRTAVYARAAEAAAR
jgi:uroporphyrin-III C-methyltransferase